MIPAFARRTLCLVATLLFVAGCAAPPAPKLPIYRNLSTSGTVFDAGAARDIINALRTKEGLEPVTLNATLTRIAGEEARAVSVRALSTGKVSPGAGLQQRVEKAGYPVAAMKANVSAGYHTIAEAFSGWRESTRHRDTMLMPDAMEMGIAALHQPRAKYKVYWTLIMARRGE